MTIGMLQSTVFGDLFGTAAMRAVFGEEALFQNCAAVEAALARAQARLHIIPEEAAAAISQAIEPILDGSAPLDFERLKRETANVGFPILPLVRQLAERAGEAGRWLHWGATTQDIMDSAVVLQIRAGLALIEADLIQLRGHLAALARKHRDTPMPGRTFLQQALPITFGYKAAVWLSAFDRHAERLAELRPRVLKAQFGGAVGTLASLGDGDAGLRTVGELARELDLGEPEITWHVARDTIAETVQFLALLGGSMAKIGDDVMLMSATEFGEAGEPFAVRARRELDDAAKTQPDFVRTSSAWHLEWIAVPEAFGYAAGALNQSVFLAGGLIVEPGGMAKNLGLTHGLIVAEAVMMGLAPQIGRNEAHDLVYDSCRAAIESGRPLYDVLMETPEIAGPLGADTLKALTDPANYLGAAQAMVDRVLKGR
jgi:3-carboxy-cis,cis-muconate cycloisomerase